MKKVPSWVLLLLYLAEIDSLAELTRRGRKGRQARIWPEDISATLSGESGVSFC